MSVHRFCRLIALALTAGALTACADLQEAQQQAKALLGQGAGAPAATPPQDTIEDKNLSPAQQQLRAQAEALSTPVWQTKTFWQGTALGAVAGGLLGWAQGGDTKDIVTGAAVGGAVGALAGAYVASKQQQYASQEQVLDSMIADVRLKNQQAEALIGSMRQVLAEDRKKLAQLQAQYRQRQITRDEAQRQLALVKADRQKLKEASQKAQEQLTVFDGARTAYQEKNPGVATPGLDQEIAGFKNRITVMNSVVNDLSIPELG